MNYPNKIIKDSKNKKINYANRGMDLENIINDANEYYKDNNIALIYKKPTPIGIVKRDYSDRGKITSAYFKEQSTLDYNGVYKGKYIEFDAKETKNKTSFPISNIHDHQIKHIEKVLYHRGIAFLIIEINFKYYIISGKILLDFIKNNERKSIPYEFINQNGIEIKYNYLKGLDYIKGLDILMEDL